MGVRGLGLPLADLLGKAPDSSGCASLASVGEVSVKRHTGRSGCWGPAVRGEGAAPDSGVPTK